MGTPFKSGASRTASTRPKEFYCTVFGQMDRSQTNLAVVLRTYFYPKEIMSGAMKHVEERWDDNASFKIICNHEVNSDPPSVMLCNPITVKAKPNSQLRIDLLNQEAFLDTREFFTDGPQLPKCLQFDVSLESYNITAGADEATPDQEARVPSIRIIRSPDEKTVASIPLVHLCDIPDAAMTGSFAFDDFCYTMDPKPILEGGNKLNHSRTWHRLPQLLVKFMSQDRDLASRVMDVAKEWENHAGLQIVMVPFDSKRDAQIRVQFSAKNMCAIGTDAEDIPDHKATMFINVARDTHPVLFRRRVLHQFGHALGFYHEFLKLPQDVEWDVAGVQLDTSMEAGWTKDQTRAHVFNKDTCSNNANFDRLSIMTLPFKRSYIKGWLPRQHQSVLSVDDKALVKHLYPLAHETHEWADPLSSPVPAQGEEESEEESEEEESDEEEEAGWKQAADRDATPVDMFSGVFHDQGEMTGQSLSDRQPSTPPASIDREGRGRRKRSEHKLAGVQYEPTEDGKKRLSTATSFFSRLGVAEDSQDVVEKPKYAYEEDPTLAEDCDIREDDFFSFRDKAAIHEAEYRYPINDRLPTPLFSPPDTPDSIPDSLAPTPVSKLFLADAFMDIREEWLTVTADEAMINITQESVPGSRKQKVQLHPGDIRFEDGGDFSAKDFRGEKIKIDTYGLSHQEKELFGERTSVVSPTELCEKENFYRVLQSSSGRPGNTQIEDDLSFAQKLQAKEKLNDKQKEFFEPTRQYVSEAEVQKLGFAPREVPLRSTKGKEKASKKKGLKTLTEESEKEMSFYEKSLKKGGKKDFDMERDQLSFRDKLQSRDYKREPIKMGLSELQPVDEDIFDLLESASKSKVNRGRMMSENRAPALISTKGHFAGTGGASGMFRETEWSSYFDYDEDNMMEYSGGKNYVDDDDDVYGGNLFSFREQLARHKGGSVHEGVKVTPAGYDSRNYLESPAPVANRSDETEYKIKGGIEKNKGRFYDDGVDLVSPNHLVEEALDRGFGGRAGDDQSDDDHIAREKKEAARKHYGIDGGEDDIARQKELNKQRKTPATKSDRSTSPTASGRRAHHRGDHPSSHKRGDHPSSHERPGHDMVEASPTSFVSEEERLRFGFEHTIAVDAAKSDKASREHSRDQSRQHAQRSSQDQRGYGDSHHEQQPRQSSEQYYRTGNVKSSSGSARGGMSAARKDWDQSGYAGERRDRSGDRSGDQDGDWKRSGDRRGTDGERRDGSGDRRGDQDGDWKRSGDKRDGSGDRRGTDGERREDDEPRRGDQSSQYIDGALHYLKGHQHYHHAMDPHQPDAQVEDRERKVAQKSPRSEASIEADLNWNLDRTHVKTSKSARNSKSGSAFFEAMGREDAADDSPFLPPITPKQQKKQPTSKSFVVSKEIATQITADALVPQQPLGDFWVNKDTILNRPMDPYADLALRAPVSQQRFYQEEDRPATFRSTFTAATETQETMRMPKFEQLSDNEVGDDDMPDVYSRLTDTKAYKQSGLAVDVWAQRTDISFTVLLYLKKNIGINWKRAGQYLGVSRERLRRIEDVGIANPKSGIEKMAQDMLFEWAEKDPQPTVAKLCTALEAADLSKLSQGVYERVNKEKQPRKKKGAKKGRKKVDDPVKVPISEETIPYRVMVYLKDNLGESWKDVAVCLKVPSPRIKSIEADAWQVEKMAYDMLHEWRQREKEHATVDRLIEALERAQCKKLVKGVQARCQSYHFRIAA